MEFAVHLGNLQDYFRDVEVSAGRVFELSNNEMYKHDMFGNVALPVFHGNI